MSDDAYEPEWEIAWHGVQPCLEDDEVQRIAGAALAFGGRAGAALSVVFVDDPTLAEMHAEYLDDPSPTDVMSFDLGDEGAGPVGELFVSVDCARRLAAERGVRFERELALYLVHGSLHLCGFDDHETDERAEMRRAEAQVMGDLGFEADLGEHE
ncbi:MAG: rRNA maturation RNase YbeY [Planctomycetota bacterium]